MKIKTRDVGLLAVGFIIGVVLTVSLTKTTPTRRSFPQGSTLILTGPALALASLPAAVASVTNTQWQAPPLHMVLPPRFIDSPDSQILSRPPPRRSVDLIDTHYQPDIILDDLK